MKWFKSLKGWQKGGMILGGGHFIIFLFLTLLFQGWGAFFLGYIEWPWIIILKKLGLIEGVGFGSYYDFIGLGLIGTIFYFFVGAIVGSVIFKSLIKD